MWPLPVNERGDGVCATRATITPSTWKPAEALASGRHHDPFAVLGPHRAGVDGRLTAIDPGADRLEVRGDAGAVFPLERVFGPVFSGPVSAAIAERTEGYVLHGTGADGAEWDHDDAFRFGPVLTDFDEYLLGEGAHHRLWEALGAHRMRHAGAEGTHFAVWAPNARRVSVVGDMNGWDGRRHPMRRRGATGVWEIFLPGVGEGMAYKYEILGRDGRLFQKADPVGFGAEHPPATASVVRDIRGYGWDDDGWMETRAARKQPGRGDFGLRGASGQLAAAPRRGRSGRYPTANMQRSWWAMPGTWGSRIWS